MIKTYGGKTPIIDESVFIADGAVIIGDVQIGSDSSVWFNTVIRGDVHQIRIGTRTNIQDLTMCHTTINKHPLHIGNNVTIGHCAMLHGCAIDDFVLIGMQATILDGAVVHPYSMVAAGSVVRENFVIPSGVLAAGVPARIVRELSDDERHKLEQSAQNYVDYVESYKSGFNIRTRK